MDNFFILAITLLSCIILGLIIGLLYRRIQDLFAAKSALSKAEQIIEDADERVKTMVLQAKEEALQTRREGESEIRERRAEIRSVERRLSNREENVDGRSRNLEKREKKVTDREKEIEQIYTEVQELKDSEVNALEKVADMSMDEAKDLIIKQAEDDISHELAVKYRDMEQDAQNTASEKARMVLGQAIQRLASDVVSEATVSSVPLPSDDM